jgi:transposase
MLGASASVRILMSTEPADMRKGADGLCALVKRQFDESVFSGTLFLFLSRRADRAKILWWSAGGFVVYYKRLELGRFKRPTPGADGRVMLTPGELQALLEGIDLRGARRSRLWKPDPGIDRDRPV